MANVKVIAIAEHGAYIGAEPSAVTGENGKFRLDGLMAGEHRLFPIYTEGGYPDGESAIFSGTPGRYKVVTIEPGRLLTDVVITMPQKGARFSALILDAETGAPVLAARIRVTNPDVPDVYDESGPNLKGVFEIVLTTNMSFNIEIRAAGYESWIYSSVDRRGRESHSIILEPGTQKEITVKLHKVKQQEGAEQKK